MENRTQKYFRKKYGELILPLCFSLFCENKIIGSIIISKFRGIALILYIVVCPDYQGHKYSKILINSTISKAKQMGIKNLYLVVTDENYPAVRIYNSVGFKKAGTSWNEVLKNDNI